MNFKKVFNAFFIIFFCAFSIMVCFKNFNHTPITKNNQDKLQVYELWHIESFEGGGANRTNYLKTISLNYEHLNPTKLFMIKTIASEQLEEALSKSVPHIISFSEQVAKTILPHLINFENEFDIKNNYLESAQYNGKLMAIPFIASGYCYFTKTNSTSNLKLYTANNNLHNALSLASENVNDNKTLTSYECYSKFVNSNNIKLLGTARDLFRIKNLESLGRFSVEYSPVSTFSDLIQYIGITTKNNDVLQFVEYLMQDFNQQKLSNLSLFSTKNISLYSETTYAKMEQALTSCHIPNIFNQ